MIVVLAAWCAASIPAALIIGRALARSRDRYERRLFEGAHEALGRVRDVHAPVFGKAVTGGRRLHCGTCEVQWPCTTLTAIDGNDAA